MSSVKQTERTPAADDRQQQALKSNGFWFRLPSYLEGLAECGLQDTQNTVCILCNGPQNNDWALRACMTSGALTWLPSFILKIQRPQLVAWAAFISVPTMQREIKWGSSAAFNVALGRKKQKNNHGSNVCCGLGEAPNGRWRQRPGYNLDLIEGLSLLTEDSLPCVMIPQCKHDEASRCSHTYNSTMDGLLEQWGAYL